MAENITLKIYTPEKTALNQKVYRVLLPYGKTNITIIEDRAPTSLVMHAGVLQILGENNEILRSYFIDGGVADVADNVCNISTRHIIEKSQINLEKALELRDSEPQSFEYYQMIVDYFSSFE